MTSIETAARFDPPANSWILFPGRVRHQSRGELRLTGPNPSDPLEIHANTLEDERDLKAQVKAVELCREIGNSAVPRDRANPWALFDNYTDRVMVQCVGTLTPKW